MLTSAILGLHGALAMLSGPIIGHFADKRPNHKITLLWSLGFCIIGTFMVAGARSVAILFIGRVVQGIAGSAVWIVGLATVANIISEDNMGSAMGLMMSFANSGTICGPAISGLMIEATSYWVTWSVPLIVLAIDLVARLAMIERPVLNTKTNEEDATTHLLSSSEEQLGPDHGGSFWRIILCDGCSLTCLFITLTSSTVTTSFHATLPLYIEERFGWGPSTAGLLFSGLVIPGLIIGPLAGWLRDRVGARLPIMAGSIVQIGLLFTLGIAGGSSTHSTSVPAWSKPVYIAAIIGIGAARPFVSGIAPAEMTAVIKLREKQNPGIFGSQGSTSRIFSLLDVAVSFGTMIGPIIGGPLKELAGWKYMNWTWSILYLIIVVLVGCFLNPSDIDSSPSEEHT
ncbi:Major facilitator superfamily domain general substrate transporter [Penicillium angulare]|uniref:Major facilitator superfamily domain general substrate transporter n=1 Tax=Penicillium angulare TaxID=116970 RepID=UPI0025422BB6|nr:Major facilitator superfamily domain general substrate transporter [Penicillium angulare]KAJ5273186.1 Major facilitator superfamily domain general substrate transporter [Penicillium angulare]